MKEPIKTLFLDIGNVLLTNGWGHDFRQQTAEHFSLDYEEMDNRHQLVFDNYEMDKVSFDEYLDLTVFYKPRSFTKDDFKTFMFGLSKALPGSIEFFTALKRQHNLRVFALSNEGREINEYRVKKFKLDELFDGYISSCYVGLHKPCNEILRLACDVSHTLPGECLYVDDRAELIDMAAKFGLQTLHFTGLDQAKEIIKGCKFQKR